MMLHPGQQSFKAAASPLLYNLVQNTMKEVTVLLISPNMHVVLKSWSFVTLFPVSDEKSHRAETWRDIPVPTSGGDRLGEGSVSRPG